MSENIRRAVPGDAADIADMIHALAEFENAADQCTVTEKQISAALFGESSIAYAHVAEVDGEIAAMALWFVNFSTWDGVAGIYARYEYLREKAAALEAWARHVDALVAGAQA